MEGMAIGLLAQSAAVRLEGASTARSPHQHDVCGAPCRAGHHRECTSVTTVVGLDAGAQFTSGLRVIVGQPQ